MTCTLLVLLFMAAMRRAVVENCAANCVMWDGKNRKIRREMMEIYGTYMEICGKYLGNTWEMMDIYIWDNHGSGSATTGIWASQTGMAWRGYNVDGLVDEGWEWCCGIFDYFWGGNLGKMWSAMPCFEWTGSYTSCYLPCVRWFWKHLTAHSTAPPGSNNRSCCLDISVCASKTLRNSWSTCEVPWTTHLEPLVTLIWDGSTPMWSENQRELKFSASARWGPTASFFDLSPTQP